LSEEVKAIVKTEGLLLKSR